MKIFSNLSEVLLDIDVDDNSYRYRSIMGDHKVVVYFSMPESIEIPVGSYIQYQGETYTLFRPENVKKNGSRQFEYEVTFGSNQELLKQFKFKWIMGGTEQQKVPFKLKFPLTAKPERFLELLVKNLNLNDQGWSVGSCIDATERVISFNHDDCFGVLNRLADEFDTEWEITGKTIHLRKTAYHTDSPLPLSYGKGNGFKTGVGRTVQGDKRPVTMLYVQGGDRNIDHKTYYSDTYKSETLLLPMDQTLLYEGRTYKTDAYGMYITRADQPLTVVSEDSYDGSAFYPSRVGEVTAVETEQGTDDEGNAVTFYDIMDQTIPDDLDFLACTMKEEKMTIIFQSGMLTGKEFELTTDQEGNLTGYVHAQRRFRLVPNDTEGGRMPNETFCPQPGDTYAVFHISLPDAYVCHNPTQGGASWEMFREAVRYMYENEEEKFSFTGELDGIWSKKNWLAVGGKLVPGSSILFSDPQFQPQGIPVRITGITDYINRPYSPTIELSNAPVAGYLSTELSKIKGEEVVNESLYHQAVQYTKRRFRDALETQKMLEGVVERFEAGVNPVWIQTMSLLAGSEDLQFRFVYNRDHPVEVNPDFRMNQDTKIFTATVASGTMLQHMTLGVDTMSNSHKPTEYMFWEMENYTSPPLSGFATPYYLYAVCPKSTVEKGRFELSEDSSKMDPGDGNYYFLVGTLGTETDGERSFTTLYGFTEILPGRITTKKIVSDNGQTYFDLSTGEIGGVIRFSGGSTGYENIDDAPDVGKAISDASNSLQDYMNGSFADSIISEAEAKSIATYIHQLETEKGRLDAAYNVLYPNSLLTGIYKTRLYESKYTLNNAYTTLISTINSAIADGKVTAAEKSNVDSRFATYKAQLKAYSQYYEEAHRSISDTSYGKATDALTAAENASNAANTANASASIAYTTATGKARVFYDTSTPSGGNTNDLWVDGKMIYRYTGNKWEPHSEYDGTLTTINRGLVTTGALVVGNSTAKGNGGIAGGGSIRIWSGGDLGAGSVIAPDKATFRVYDDGKIVSKQSFQVENANAIVNAGFQSTGTANNSVRLWVGNATPASAPFQVSNDGSITARKGKIGGFDISNGWLKSDYDAGYLDMKGSNTRIAFGADLAPGVIGGVYTCTGMIQNTKGDSYTNQAIGLQIKAGGTAKYAVAADLDGGLKVRGGISFVEDVPDVSDNTDTITSQDLAFRRTFVFQPITYRTVHLPTSSNISSMFGYNSKGYAASWQSVIRITIIVSRYATDRINIQCSDPILDNNGNNRKDNNGVSVSNFDMGKGDCCELAYFNGAWYTLSLSK